ncbi:UDP-2,3-diacylglucosamine diphosphatase LpxI domain-containing protein [Roseovarius sp. D22-M7]|uniref:UDP-2,3-diacylglucosamine diphosphatase LpxI domain-containing protein n=1 Tax=Roseovarius sp. D22-M7 TaxID=3127116 RepID=UPI0030101128
MTLALVAGPGEVPPHLVRTCLARGEVPLICELDGDPSDILGDLPRQRFRFETFGSLLHDLTARGITRLCIAGHMARPGVDPARIDAATARFLPRLQAALGQGDDAVRREIVTIIEEAGIEVVAAPDIAADLLPAPGVLTGAVPDGVAADLATAQAEMARTDTGQAVVVRGGHVVASAGARGTDAMLHDLATPGDTGAGWTLDPFDVADQLIGGAADWLSAQDGAGDETGGIFYIAPRRGQDPRTDLPVIDASTARCATHARLDGIVIGEGAAMLLAPDDVRDILTAAGLFLWVRPAGG